MISKLLHARLVPDLDMIEWKWMMQIRYARASHWVARSIPSTLQKITNCRMKVKNFEKSCSFINGHMKGRLHRNIKGSSNCGKGKMRFWSIGDTTMCKGVSDRKVINLWLRKLQVSMIVVIIILTILTKIVIVIWCHKLCLLGFNIQ